MSVRRVVIGGILLVVLALLVVGIVRGSRSSNSGSKSAPSTASSPTSQTPSAASNPGVLSPKQFLQGPKVPKIIPESLPPKLLSPSQERQVQRNQPALLDPTAPKGRPLAVIPAYLQPILTTMGRVGNLTAIVSFGHQRIHEAYVNDRICAEGKVEEHTDSQSIWGSFIPPITNPVTIHHHDGEEIIRWHPKRITDATTTTIIVGANHRLIAVRDSTIRIKFSYGSAACAS